MIMIIILHSSLLVFFLFAQEVHTMQFGLVKSGLFDGKETGSVFISEPNFVALFINHPGCLRGIAHLKKADFK